MRMDPPNQDIERQQDPPSAGLRLENIHIARTSNRRRPSRRTQKLGYYNLGRYKYYVQFGPPMRHPSVRRRTKESLPDIEQALPERAPDAELALLDALHEAHVVQRARRGAQHRDRRRVLRARMFSNCKGTRSRSRTCFMK